MDYILSFVLLGWFLGILKLLLRSWKSMTNVPNSMPWAGIRNEIFPNLRACLREFIAGVQILRIGYANVRVPDPCH